MMVGTPLPPQRLKGRQSRDRRSCNLPATDESKAAKGICTDGSSFPPGTSSGRVEALNNNWETAALGLPTPYAKPKAMAA